MFKSGSLNRRLQNYIGASVREFDLIPPERNDELDKIARYIKARSDTGCEALLTFICTHNSRRSHMAQVWAQTAAAYYGVSGLRTFSGGTAATAFSSRAAAALSRAGFAVAKTTGGSNPVYEISYARSSEPMRVFSKVYSDESNPRQEFCAVMTCSDADRNCPVVFGASERVSIPYEDPKNYDGTPQEAEKYDECCRLISREMLRLFSIIG